jgi:hypothetical protein
LNRKEREDLPPLGVILNGVKDPFQNREELSLSCKGSLALLGMTNYFFAVLAVFAVQTCLYLSLFNLWRAGWGNSQGDHHGHENEIR